MQKLDNELKNILSLHSRFDTFNNEKLFSKIKELCTIFNPADVLSSINDIWSFDKSLDFFSSLKHKPTYKSNITTIGMFCDRGYNGGIEKVNSQLINIFKNMGYNVVFFSSEPPSKFDYEYNKNIKRIVIPRQTNERLHKLERAILSEKIDLFITHNRLADAALWDCLLCRFIGIPYILHTHENFSCYLLPSNVKRFNILKLPDLLITTSKTFAKFYQLCGITNYLVNNPIPNYLLNNKDVTNCNNKSVAIIGRINADKNIIAGIRAFDILHKVHKDVYLDIYGTFESKKYENEVNNIIDELDLNKYVKFHGFLDSNSISNHLKKTDVLLFPSIAEGYSMVILEAKCYAVPIVMFDLKYLTLVEDDKGTLTVPMNDCYEMGQTLIKLYSDSNYRNEISRQARSSFLNFATYNEKNEWNNIIGIAKGERVKSANFYDSSLLSDSEKYIMPILLNSIITIERECRLELHNSRDFKVGRIVNYFPRKGIILLRKIKFFAKRLCSKFLSLLKVLKYEFLCLKYLFMKKIRVLSINDTIDYIIQNNSSMSRFGDGEMNILTWSSDIGFQKRDENLKSELKEILKNGSNDNFLCCIPSYCLPFISTSHLTTEASTFYRNNRCTYFKKWLKHVNRSSFYGETNVTRNYIDLKNKNNLGEYFNKIKKIFNNRKICIVEGDKTRFGVGNDLLSKADEIFRVICPSENAYEKIDLILDTIRKIDKNILIACSLGPTATVLCYRLYKLGYQALDIGHLDLEYEWFLRKCDYKAIIENKYCNELNYRPAKQNYNEHYRKQIIADLTK